MRRLRSHGVTLVELLVVISILGIVAVVAIPDSRSVDPQRLQLASAGFAEAIRFARSESIRTGTPYGFFVDPAGKRIQLYRADMGTSPPTPIYDVYHPVSKQLYDIDLDNHPFASADSMTGTSAYQGVCSSTGHTQFNASGVPYCRDPNTVIFRQGSLTFTLGVQSRVVNLDGITGRVTVQ